MGPVLAYWSEVELNLNGQIALRFLVSIQFWRLPSMIARNYDSFATNHGFHGAASPVTPEIMAAHITMALELAQKGRTSRRPSIGLRFRQNRIAVHSARQTHMPNKATPAFRHDYRAAQRFA
jgi:hypothetical protein